MINLIENNGVTLFLLGNKGNFDFMVYKQLKLLSEKYSINYYIVKAYLQRPENDFGESQNTIIADGAEWVPPKFAISHRNHWMLKQADFVITYVSHPSSGASKFQEAAKKNKKNVINLYDLQQKSKEVANIKP